MSTPSSSEVIEAVDTSGTNEAALALGKPTGSETPLAVGASANGALSWTQFNTCWYLYFFNHLGALTEPASKCYHLAGSHTGIQACTPIY